MVVVFGWGDSRAKDLGEVAPATCPQCHNDVFIHELHSEKQFSLYFVPLSSYGGKEYLVCPICHFGLQFLRSHKATIDQMRARTNSFRKGLVPAAAYQQTVEQFWATVGRNNTGQQMLHAPASLTAAPMAGGPATAPPSAAAPTTATPAATPVLADQLAGLGRLHDEGVLTDEEFEKAKRRLLGL